jgi:hypothetical protein
VSNVLLRRLLPLVVVAFALLGAGLPLGNLASAAGATPPAGELSANIAIGTLPAACDTAPTGTICTNAVVAGLDNARADVGLGPYVLPTNFDALSGTRQIFILSNLDRVAYGLPPIDGLSPTLAPASHSGMLSDNDPDPTALLAGLATYSWTSNWAGNWANAPYAYYEWMYDDGYAGAQTTNIDCTSPTASGCWDHRRNVLAFASTGTLALGASVGTDAQGDSSYATTLVWTPGDAWTSYSYTWAQAQADGAGAPHSSRLSRRGGHRRRSTH